MINFGWYDTSQTVRYQWYLTSSLVFYVTSDITNEGLVWPSDRFGILFLTGLGEIPMRDLVIDFFLESSWGAPGGGGEGGKGGRKGYPGLLSATKYKPALRLSG